VATAPSLERLPILVEYLRTFYEAKQPATIYEAAAYPVCEPLIAETTLDKLPSAPVTGLSTLYVPPAKAPIQSPEMIERLGLAPR
jgi:hypothetical protein